MSAMKFAVGSVVCGMLMYAVGYVFWDILLLDYYTANSGAAGAGLRENQVLWAALLGTLIYGALVTHLVGAKSGATTMASGLKAGALAGFLLWGAANFIVFGFLDLWYITVVLLDIVLETVRGAIGGAAVALLLAKVPD